MIEAGGYFLLLTLVLSIISGLSLVYGLYRKDSRFIEVAFRASKSIFIFLSICILLLIYFFVTDNFKIEYVSAYSEKSLPLFYKITGLWAGQKGSLLLWTWLLALYTFIVVKKDEQIPNTSYLPYVLFVLNTTLLFFLILLNFFTPPFEMNRVFPSDGNGLNPLLQNPGMVFHPPTLYLGYVGFTVPFAFAIAALITKDLGHWWIRRTRIWTLSSWVFLTLGIVFGGWWAYRELGWGGVWGWDPVENASLMPWFTATAFLHSIIIQEKRGMLKIWNIILIILTFSLSIFGTFITRSGVITSVHAFGQSSIGYVFLGFLIIIVVVSVWLIWSRYDKLKERNPRIESIISKESSFLYNNIILFGLAFATFWGTIFPLLVQAVKGVKISVGPPFFNKVNTPLFLSLLILMAVCPLLAWRSTSIKAFKKSFIQPTIVMFLSIAGFILLGLREFMPIFFYAFCIFVIVSLFREFYIGTKANMSYKKMSFFKAFLSLIVKNRRRYGGFIVHIGIVLMITGLVGYGYFQYKESFNLSPYNSVTIKGYKLKYLKLQSSRTDSYTSIAAAVEVSTADDEFLTVMKPEKRFYRKKEPTTEVAIRSTLFEDLYLILNGWDSKGNINLTVVINPLLIWTWIGAGIVVIGVILCVFPATKQKNQWDAVEKELILSLKEVHQI